MAHLDLSAADAARREAVGEAPTFDWNGETYKLPVELPYEVLEYHARLNAGDTGALVDVCKLLLGDQWDQFSGSKPRPVAKTLDALIGFAMAEYKMRGSLPTETEANGSPRPTESARESTSSASG